MTFGSLFAGIGGITELIMTRVCHKMSEPEQALVAPDGFYTPSLLRRQGMSAQSIRALRSRQQVCCRVCGKTFVSYNLNPQFCSRECRPKIKRDQKGSKNSSWRGDAATYSALHARVETARGKPSVCEECGRTDGRFEWANLTGNYADTSDYKRLCVSCHRHLDLARRRALGRNTVTVPRRRKEQCP